MRVTVLAMVIVTELIVQILSAAMVPFFPDFAEKHLGANSTVVGVIFSLYPLSLFLTSLVVGMVSARFGRVFVFTVGLVLLGGGTVGFGFCRDLTSIMLVRVVQGVGGGCINVAGMALLLQVSTNIERDVGLDQAAIGLGYIVSACIWGVMLDGYSLKERLSFYFFGLLLCCLYCVLAGIPQPSSFSPLPLTLSTKTHTSPHLYLSFNASHHLN